MVLMIGRDILTRNSFLNAIAIVNVLGGSTNSVSKTNIAHDYANSSFNLRSFTYSQWLVQLMLTSLSMTSRRWLTVLRTSLISSE